MRAILNTLGEYFRRHLVRIGGPAVSDRSRAWKKRDIAAHRWPDRYFEQLFGRWEGELMSRKPHNSQGKIMDRVTALQLLREEREHLTRRFDVADLALFGSVARDEGQAGSDIDILVRFDGPATSRRYFGLQFYLEDLLGCPVDLVTDKALRRELRPH